MTKFCKVTECTRQQHSKSLCEMHYRRLRRTGKLGESGSRYGEPRRSVANLEQSFLGGFTKTEGCWLWQKGKTTAGYGQIYLQGIGYYAHRYSYEYYIGEIPEGLTIDHLCYNKACVNPKHLEPVTISENVIRYWEVRRGRRSMVIN